MPFTDNLGQLKAFERVIQQPGYNLDNITSALLDGYDNDDYGIKALTTVGVSLDIARENKDLIYSKVAATIFSQIVQEIGDIFNLSNMAIASLNNRITNDYTQLYTQGYLDPHNLPNPSEVYKNLGTIEQPNNFTYNILKGLAYVLINQSKDLDPRHESHQTMEEIRSVLERAISILTKAYAIIHLTSGKNSDYQCFEGAAEVA